MWAVSRKDMTGVYEVPGSGNGKARPRFKTEAERIGHRETVRRRDESRLAEKKTAEGREKRFQFGGGFLKL